VQCAQVLPVSQDFVSWIRAGWGGQGVNSWWWLLLGFPIGIGAAWFFVKSKRTADFMAPRERKMSGPVAVTRNQPRQQAYHHYGVSVQLDNNPCDAIRAIADHRYLSAEAPRLPLPDCDRDECRCFVQPQDDRRAGYDRRGDSFSAYGNFELDRHTQKRHDEDDRRGSS
jgi:hypothetical protein